MLKKIIILAIIVVIILAIVVVLAVNLSSQQKTQSPSANIPASEKTNVSTSSENLGENAWKNPENPSQSSPLEQSEVPKDAIKISITEGGIAPASFEAKAGAQIILAVSSGDQWTHVFKFKAKSLEQVAVGVGPKETRAITFYAPKEKGEYEYYCDVPGHITRGEKGVMIVK